MLNKVNIVANISIEADELLASLQWEDESLRAISKACEDAIVNSTIKQGMMNV